jgi:hypothetical protein
MNKLREEKRKTPIGRKGNVIEPIMRWYCKLQMIYWPYHLLSFWVWFNEIIPFEYMNGWWCSAATFIAIKFGRMCIGWNSLFVALIRYIYIVHRQKMNQWDFEKIGRFFRISSIAVPVGIEAAGLLSNSYPNQIAKEGYVFKSCVASLQGHNTTLNIQMPEPYFRALTIHVVPEWVILGVYSVYICLTIAVFSNVIDGFFYLQIYRTIKRYIGKPLNK